MPSFLVNYGGPSPQITSLKDSFDRVFSDCVTAVSSILNTIDPTSIGGGKKIIAPFIKLLIPASKNRGHRQNGNHLQ